MEIRVVAAVIGAFFELEEIAEGGVELVLEGGEVAAEEVEGAGGGSGGGDPGLGEGGEFAGAFGGLGEGVEAGGVGELVVEEGGFDDGETFFAPVDLGELLDEAEGEESLGAEFIDEGLADGFEFGVVFDVEDGVFGGGESVFEGVAGGVFEAFGGGGAFGFFSVEAGAFGAGEYLGLRFGFLG